MKRTMEEIEAELDALQIEYIGEDDEVLQLDINRRFSALRNEATELDGVLRVSAGVTINNWVKESSE